MNEVKKILIAEDQPVTAKYFQKILLNMGYIVGVANNGVEAYIMMKKMKYDCLITDWLMPDMNGIELIEKVRNRIIPSPLIIMITVKGTDSAKSKAFESGADEFMLKPIDRNELEAKIAELFLKLDSSETHSADSFSPFVNNIAVPKKLPPFPAVAIAASTGGPQSLLEVLGGLPPDIKAAIYIVQHGPSWMLDSFAKRITKSSPNPAYVAKNGFASSTGISYLAPGDAHLIINKENYFTAYFNGPPENYVKPSADPLFRSVAESFGKYCVGVVLTGLGIDGTKGAAAIFATGGKILVQNPVGAIAPSMPRSVVKSGIPHELLQLEEISKKISDYVDLLNFDLKMQKKY